MDLWWGLGAMAGNNCRGVVPAQELCRPPEITVSTEHNPAARYPAARTSTVLSLTHLPY
jgi:hypothetical protein